MLFTSDAFAGCKYINVRLLLAFYMAELKKMQPYT